jgi:two-component system cell cycle sensor histidine kinase PleC
MALTFGHKLQGNLAKALDYQEELTKLIEVSLLTKMSDRVQELEAMHAAESDRWEARHQRDVFRLSNIELTQANIHLSESMEQTKHFLRVLQHDLRSPLNSIVGFAEIIGEESTDEIQSYAGLIQRSGRRMVDIVDGVLESARQGSLLVERSSVTVAQLIDGVLELVRPLAESKQIRLRELDRTQNREMHLDRPKVQQAITNLLFNAVKFTPSGKTICLCAEFDSGEDERRVLRITVRDEGVGMTPAILEQLRAVLTHASPPTEAGGVSTQRLGTMGETGSGMGLRIARSIIALHDGTITLDSEEGMGTTVTIEIPERHQGG